MKKTLFTFSILVMLSFSAIQAQFIHISGYITNESSGLAVPDHEVYIMDVDSLGIYSVATTNGNGYYFDTIPTGGMNLNALYVYTNDLCTFGIHDTMIYNPGTQVMADFEICVDSVPLNCNADFYYISDSNAMTNTVYFYDLSTPVGLIDNWWWNFGDGNVSYDQNPVHTYTIAGTYNVCLTIENQYMGGVCYDTLCMDVTITGGGGTNCQANFYDSISGSNPNIVYFYDNSTPYGLIDNWYWEFGDGTTSSVQYPVHTYSTSGLYNVCLTITADSGMCTSVFCDSLYISGGGIDCEADFYYVQDSIAEFTVLFFDQSTPANTITSWDWSFGDGGTSTLQNPLYQYNAAGTYNVCLTIESQSQGAVCYDTYCMDVTVTGSGEQYQLGGNVFAGIYQLDQGFAYAYKSENGVITDVYSDFIDTLGYYLFYPLAAVDYYVKAEPSPNSAYYGSYMPTYYGDAVTWEDAQLINLTQNVYTADINLVPMNQAAAGPGQISGNIVHGATLRSNTPAEGVQIMIANETGEFVGLEYSDEEGLFSFSGISLGTYFLYAEVAGLNMIPGEFILSEDNQSIDDIHMVMTDDEIYFDLTGVETLGDLTVSEVYPNPVHNSFRIDLGSDRLNNINVRVHNQLGQVIQQQEILLDGQESLTINTSGLKQGMYYVEIITQESYRLTRRFVKM